MMNTYQPSFCTYIKYCKLTLYVSMNTRDQTAAKAFVTPPLTITNANANANTAAIAQQYCEHGVYIDVRARFRMELR